MENVLSVDDVNFLEFPTPNWHDGDGGRYIGTGSFNVTKDPESDRVNVGTYRVMVDDDPGPAGLARVTLRARTSSATCAGRH